MKLKATFDISDDGKILLKHGLDESMIAQVSVSRKLIFHIIGRLATGNDIQAHDIDISDYVNKSLDQHTPNGR